METKKDYIVFVLSSTLNDIEYQVQDLVDCTLNKLGLPTNYPENCLFFLFVYNNIYDTNVKDFKFAYNVDSIYCIDAINITQSYKEHFSSTSSRRAIEEEIERGKSALLLKNNQLYCTDLRYKIIHQKTKTLHQETKTLHSILQKIVMN